jgi:hypothetical protein
VLTLGVFWSRRLVAWSPIVWASRECLALFLDYIRSWQEEF